MRKTAYFIMNFLPSKSSLLQHIEGTENDIKQQCRYIMQIEKKVVLFNYVIFVIYIQYIHICKYIAFGVKTVFILITIIMFIFRLHNVTLK